MTIFVLVCICKRQGIWGKIKAFSVRGETVPIPFNDASNISENFRFKPGRELHWRGKNSIQ